ncbi:MAG TPA: cupin domain-containing protein [Actinomycetota bacterium]|nr:cupin domain-containing protein [Actinomycetota bacterium]
MTRVVACPIILAVSPAPSAPHDEEEEARMNEVARSFEGPDKTLAFEHGSLESVNVAGTGGALIRMVMHPGWRWSTDLRTMVGTDTCQTRHVGYCLEGTLHVQLDDGVSYDINPGDAFVIPSGHDAWVLGDATCTILDWGSMARAE